ncbi:peptidoglycan DD-metalloendopeptidase family protein [Paraburkholderia sp. LEh10]|uniref:M23 family metallopeptidase n=1 Tax=Paraburkholderia sp. LEh10 TaxID=2821353 RepID=UPI001AE86749|nr:M23 family metallopeptidase [Paraburkholderia sp. LEh10]MBP0590047.1 peptidoglycan DD-metalloendopeptidase family protein [Paraburkholderia sp. LEh10]
MRPTQSNRPAHLLRAACLAALLAMGGCVSLPWQMAPEDRSLTHPTQAAATSVQQAPHAAASSDKPLPPVKDGYYRVKPGDTLYRIATAHGQRSDDIVKWNNLTDANHIETGGMLRVVPPPDATADGKAASTPPTAPAASKASAKRDAASDANAKTAKQDNQDNQDKDDRGKAADNGKSRFGWPARGTLSAVYGQGKSKGIVIAARAGDPVKAAAPGRVVFAGDGGKPYGKLIVIKHDNDLVTAYSHNRTLLVKEGTTVRRGETIAEMAETGRGDGSLRFEVRKNGKPVDPAPYLPRVGS